LAEEADLPQARLTGKTVEIKFSIVFQQSFLMYRNIFQKVKCYFEQDWE
jgi:hypothetical protein